MTSIAPGWVSLEPPVYLIKPLKALVRVVIFSIITFWTVDDRVLSCQLADELSMISYAIYLEKAPQISGI